MSLEEYLPQLERAADAGGLVRNETLIIRDLLREVIALRSRASSLEVQVAELNRFAVFHKAPE